MKKDVITAKSFLKSQELRELYECGICYEVCMKPVRCRGPCAHIFCMKCVSDARQNTDKCPFKCSSPFLVSTLPDLRLDFFCPYNPSECKLGIYSLHEFDNHYKQCPFVSEEELCRKKMQNQYKCLKGHQLQFFIGSYQEMMKSTCVQCQEQKLCRSICRQCEQLYCVSCRALPCSKDGCPMGHSFSFQRIANLNFICDMCGVSTAVSDDGVYDDAMCNLGICEGCYKQLPEHFDQSKPRQLVANISTTCMCTSKLIYKPHYHSVATCDLCLKEKECPKQCPNCKKRFCLKCKIVDIQGDDTCLFEHEMEEMSPEQAGEKHDYGCMRCGEQYEEYIYDKHCKTRLCGNCFGYCKSVSSDKERPMIKKCQANHVMMYIRGPEDVYQVCRGCHKTKIIKLQCIYCQEEDHQMFCFECRPIRLDTCYYQHPLKKTAFQGNRECHYCLVENSQFHYCKKCQFYVCEHCVQKSLAMHRPDQPWEVERAAPCMVKKEEAMEAEGMECQEGMGQEACAGAGKEEREDGVRTAMDLQELQQQLSMLRSYQFK